MSICMPVYNGAEVITDTLRSILGQTFRDFELVIADDASTDATQETIQNIAHPSIKYYRHETNVGYPRNLERCRTRCSGDIVFLMGQDDILAQGTLERVYSIFQANENVGAITRPYYWFHRDVKNPVRAKEQLDPRADSVVSISSDLRSIVKVFSTLDQLSGLAYRRSCMDRGFHDDVFTAHVYPFASIFKKHEIVYLRDYTVAVRIGTSQTRHVSSIYTKSPMQSWVDMFNDVLRNEQFRAVREYCIRNFVAKNFVGLIQIKNYGKTSWVLREIGLLEKYNEHNLFDGRFWLLSIGTLLIPRSILIPLVDTYKEEALSRFLSKRINPISIPEW